MREGLLVQLCYGGLVVQGESIAKITVIPSIEVRTISLMPAQHALRIHVMFLHNYCASYWISPI